MSPLHLLVSAVSGFMFAMGLGISGMSQPDKVTAFLDLAGQWDPSLAGVMFGALLVFAPTYYIYRKLRDQPLLGGDFALPTTTAVDQNLLLGAILFGVGWGLSGLCPGPSVVVLVTHTADILPFFSAMVIGMILPSLWRYTCQ